MPNINHISDVSICCETLNVENTFTFPNCKLQTLDRRVGKEKLYFDKNLFAQSVDDWNGVPIIFQKDGVHPTDFKAVEADPEKASMQIGGKLVGHVSNPRIVVQGGARLMASLDIDTDYEKLLALWQQGKLFPSTAFETKSDGDRILTPPKPNHVLLFPAEEGKVLPGDFGAYVNTIVETKSMADNNIPEEIQNDVEQIQSDDKKKSKLYSWIEETVSKILDSKLKAKNAKKEDEEEEKEEEKDKDTEKDSEKKKEEEEDEEDEKKKTQSEVQSSDVKSAETEVSECNTTEKSTIQNAEEKISVNSELQERDNVINGLKSEIESLKNSVSEFESVKAELQKYKDAEREQKFTRFLQSVPVGMKSTDEQKENLRKQFETDFEGLVFTVLESKVDAKLETQSVGNKYVYSDTNSKSGNSLTTVGNLFGTKKEN